MLDMRDVTGIKIPIYDTRYYREVEYIQVGSSNGPLSSNDYIITNYTLGELLNGNTLSVTVSNLYGGVGYNGLFRIGPGSGDPYFGVYFRTVKYSDDSLGYSPAYAITTNGESTTVDTGRAMNPDDTFRVSLTLGTLGNANTTLTVVDLTTDTQIVSIDDITLPADLSGYTSDKFQVLGMGVGGYIGIKLYAVNATINNVNYTIYPAQDKLYTNGTLWSDDNQSGLGAMAWDDRINDIIQVSGYPSSHRYLGLTVNNNPGWEHTFVEQCDVVKIEDYYNGNLRQIWPCWNPDPANPTAPTVQDIYEYDDSIVWTVGTGEENSDNFYYYPITATGEAWGIQIALADNTYGWPSDGKPTSGREYTWKVTAPRAGHYQMVISAMMTSDGHSIANMSNINVAVNDTSTTRASATILEGTYGDLPNFTATEYNDVVVAVVSLTGNEDTIHFKQQAYRWNIDPSSNIIFREIAFTPTATGIVLDTSNVQTLFTQGDTFNYTGLIVYQKYNDNSTTLISSGYTVSSPDMSTTGDKTVTVTYGAFTATYSIHVSSAGGAWITTNAMTNSDNLTYDEGTYAGFDAVRIPVLNVSSGSFGSDGRVSSTSTDLVYKITAPSAGDYMLILPIKKGSGDPQFYVNNVSIGTVSGTTTTAYLYAEITYPVTLTTTEQTLTIRNNSYRCYWDTDDYVYLVKTSTNPFPE